MKLDTIISIKPEPDKKARRKGIPNRRDDDTWRRRVRNQPFEYTNTRTIHYETYRAFADPTYFNGHNSVVVGGLYAFIWTGGPGDNLYDPATINYHFTFDGTTYTWDVSGSPEGGGDFSGSTSFPSPVDPALIIEPSFSASVHVVGLLSVGDDISGTVLIEPQWYSDTRTLTYHVKRDAGESSGEWDDDGHPGVTVYGNNVQAEETFVGGDGFTNPVTGAPKPDDWTVQIQAEADAVITLLEAEPHIRNVSESDIDIDFVGS